jgi:hypothetical protein
MIRLTNKTKILFSSDNKTVATTIFKSIKAQSMTTKKPQFIKFKIKKEEVKE